MRPPSYHDELEPYFPHQRFPSPPAADIRNNFGHQFDQQFVGHSQQMARNNGMYTYGPGLLQSQDQNEMGPNNYRRTMPSIHKMDYGIGDRAILDRISLARPTEKSGDCYTFQPVDGRCRETENLNIPPERIPAYIAAGGRTEPIGAVNGQYFGDNGEYYDDDYGPQQHPKQMKMNSFWPNPHPFPAPNHSWRHGKPFDDRFGGRRSPHEVNNNQQQQFQYTDYDDPQNFLAARRSNLPFEASITNRNDSSESSETYEQMMNRLSPTFQSSSIVRGSRLPLLAEPPVVDDAETALKKHQQEALNAYASAYRSPSPPGGGFNVVNQGQGYDLIV